VRFTDKGVEFRVEIEDAGFRAQGFKLRVQGVGIRE